MTRSLDKIDAALDYLHAMAGFDVRSAVADCNSCTLATIDEESPRYAFYHEQNVDDWDTNGSMHIGFGPDADAGRQVVAAFKALGMQVDWDGTVGQKVEVRE